MMNGILEKAIFIAVNAHHGQTDKGGMPYIFHPFRVMNNVAPIEQKIVAILHDVLEDTPVTFDELKEQGIPEYLVEALKLLTHNKNISYEDYIMQIVTNPIARAVKIADLSDNMNVSRLKEITEKDIERIKKYNNSYNYLMCKINQEKK